jgi:hypothetical protein
MHKRDGGGVLEVEDELSTLFNEFLDPPLLKCTSKLHTSSHLLTLQQARFELPAFSQNTHDKSRLGRWDASAESHLVSGAGDERGEAKLRTLLAMLCQRLGLCGVTSRLVRDSEG